MNRLCQSTAPVSCGPHGSCTPSTGTCTCDAGWSGSSCSSCADGYVPVGDGCVPGSCTTDAQCDDGDPCNGRETCGPDHHCSSGLAVSCGEHGSCDGATGACACDQGYTGSQCEGCDDGYHAVSGQCLPDACAGDAACDDGHACNGTESCSEEGACMPGTAVACGQHAHCQEPDGTCACDPGYELTGGVCEPGACEIPQAPTLSIIHAGATLSFTVPGGQALEVGTSNDANAVAPASWMAGSSVALPSLPQLHKVFGRIAEAGCEASTFAFTYEVRSSYPPAAGEPDSMAVAMDDPRIAGWAVDWEDPVAYGADVDDAWRHPENAIGPAQGTSTDIVALGRGGSIVLQFDPPITNGPGADFAVFENSFSDSFLELAYVEVSSNGTNFVRFDSVYLGGQPLGPYAMQEPSSIGGLAGTYRQGFGTPFDLEVFVNRPEVHAAIVDLSSITHVRIVDIVGDGTAHDSFGHVIWDPYPTQDSAGFDLDAVAVLNAM
ncbi:MAG: calcium-binding EGF-like domain-containing protein [Myxococcota bacterium]